MSGIVDTVREALMNADYKWLVEQYSFNLGWNRETISKMLVVVNGDVNALIAARNNWRPMTNHYGQEKAVEFLAFLEFEKEQRQ